MRRSGAVVVERLGRLLWCSLGVLAVVWSFLCLPVIWQQAPVSAAAKRIISGDSFTRDALDDIASKASGVSGSKWSHPSGLASAAIVQIRRLEQAIGDADQSVVDRRQAHLEAAIETALSKEPADPYLWLVLFWLENARNGFSADHLRYLSMSYALGPNEGWIAAIRNRLALALFPALTFDLQNEAVSEFANLVDSGFVTEAAHILTGPGWSLRARLLPALAGTDDVYREQFAKAVYQLGYDISVPGVKPFGYRPWR